MGATGIVWRAVGGTAAIALRAAHLWSSLRGSREREQDLAERLALGATLGSLPAGAAWLHGASVGEVRALVPLARALDTLRPDLPQLVTATTSAGRARAVAETGGVARLAPLDAEGALARFLGALRPCLHVVVETELWPARLAALRRARVPAALVSARLSPERVPAYRRLRGLYGPALHGLSLIAPASAADHERFLKVGADPARLVAAENLKWDAAPPAPASGEAATLRRRLGLTDGPAWIVLGSVHPGEALDLLEHIRTALGAAASGIGFLLAPRHPDRFAGELAAIERAFGPAWPASRGPAPPDARLVVLDTIGILPRVYALARAGVLGGSFVPVGGHTPLEAAAAGCPLVAGPHTVHQHDLLEPLIAARAVVTAPDTAAAAAILAWWIADPARAAEAGAAGRAIVDARRGVARRLAERVAALVSPGPIGAGA